MNTDELITKRIGILGLGDENIALVKYLINRGAKDITICDKKSRGELQKTIDQFTIFNFQLSFKLGPMYLDNLKDFDVVFRSPGLPYLNEKIQKAKEEGVEISSAIKLFFDLSPASIIGITGTKGKGTTSTLIYEILKKQFQISKRMPKGKFQINRDVYLAGNIGNSPFEFLDKLTKDDFVILELSSFQLQDMEKSPHIAVVLDIKSDHLDYHKNQEEYIKAKENIVKYQKENDIAIINADYETSKNLSKITPAEKYYFSRHRKVTPGAYVLNDKIILNTQNIETVLLDKNEITLRGDHNLENICAAIIASKLVCADEITIAQTVKSFPGLEHRLEFIGEVNKIKFYNDSFSTNPDTAIAAIKSFKEPIILIAGGSEKNADYSELGKEISNSSVKTVILIGETGPRIKEKCQMSNVKCQKLKIIDTCKNLDEVIIAIKKEMKSGDVVLLSPASASFDWFSNYKERGKMFKREINKVIESSNENI